MRATRPSATRRQAARASSSRSRSATTSTRPETLNAELTKGFSRAADLPHRPLPGQRDGSEHPGAPVRQRHLRADLEPALRRQRADHRGREPRHRRAAATTTTTAGAIRDMVQNHMMQLLSLVAMEPPVTFDADAVRNEKVKVLAAIPPLHAARSSIDTRARRSTGAGSSTASAVPGYLQETGCQARLADRDLRGAQAEHRKLALGGRAVLPAHRQAAPKRATEIAIQFKRPRTCSSRARGRRAIAAEHPRRCGSSPTRASRCASRPKSPARGCSCAPVNMDFRYGTSFGVQPPEAYERLLLDVHARRPDALHPHRRDRACLAARGYHRLRVANVQ